MICRGAKPLRVGAGWGARLSSSLVKHSLVFQNYQVVSGSQIAANTGKGGCGNLVKKQKLLIHFDTQHSCTLRPSAPSLRSCRGPPLVASGLSSHRRRRPHPRFRLGRSPAAKLLCRLARQPRFARRHRGAASPNPAPRAPWRGSSRRRARRQRRPPRGRTARPPRDSRARTTRRALRVCWEEPCAPRDPGRCCEALSRPTGRDGCGACRSAAGEAARTRAGGPKAGNGPGCQRPCRGAARCETSPLPVPNATKDRCTAHVSVLSSVCASHRSRGLCEGVN